MSRWFRHYAGMVRDDKLVRASLRCKQSIERVVWVWGAVLESAAEIDEDGRYEVDASEIAYFLRCKPAAIEAVLTVLEELGRTTDGHVTSWAKRQFKSDRSNERVAAHRAKKRTDGNTDVTLPKRYGNSPETETETETDKPTDKSVGSRTARGTRLADDFVMPEDWILWAMSERHWARADVDDEVANFIDYWHGKAGRDATKLDWPATWRMWVRNSRRTGVVAGGRNAIHV